MGYDGRMQTPTTRSPWPADFPEVVIHTTVATRDAHPGYGPAKSGDAEAALALAQDLIDTDCVSRLADIADGCATSLLPVITDELTGFNAIPDAAAQIIGHRPGVPVTSGEVVQINKVGHTRAPAFQRLVTPADFPNTCDRPSVLDEAWRTA